jgi:hypothetical protein
MACFGFNESFAGRPGLRAFEDSPDKYVTETASIAHNGRAPPRPVLVFPVAAGDPGRPVPADGRGRDGGKLSGLPRMPGRNRMFFLTNPLRPGRRPVQFHNLLSNPATIVRPARPAMQKWMCLGAIGVAGLALLLCALDLVTGIPFGGGPYLLADIGGIITAGVLIYLGFNAYQDVK